MFWNVNGTLCDDIKLRKYEIGDLVTGKRSGRREITGILVDAYVTINKGRYGTIYRNPAYVVEGKGGERIVYQSIKKVVEAI